MFTEFIVAHLTLLIELGGAVLFFVIVIGLGSLLIARFDRMPLEDAVYFAFITALTIGFGDLTPQSRGARVVTVLLSMVGVFIVGVAVAVAVHALEIVMAARGA